MCLYFFLSLAISYNDMSISKSSLSVSSSMSSTSKISNGKIRIDDTLCDIIDDFVIGVVDEAPEQNRRQLVVMVVVATFR